MVSTSSPQSRKLAQTVSKYVKVIYLIADQCIFNHCLQRQSHDQSWNIKILPNYRILYHLFLLRPYFKSFLTSRQKKIQQNSIEIHRLHIASHKFTTTYSHMRSNRKARISGLVASTHVRNRTLPDLPSISFPEPSLPLSSGTGKRRPLERCVWTRHFIGR